ncbi:unnamed protein product [Paramecium primaurelia]|uniref:Uncharacterized protein n=1 Tax=Paramecium primaurelia TaxID=5886 RepID=A0A8S1KGT9_PARPR|nr:unnamed protein product [Paramecium primaurelia]
MTQYKQKKVKNQMQKGIRFFISQKLEIPKNNNCKQKKIHYQVISQVQYFFQIL